MPVCSSSFQREIPLAPPGVFSEESSPPIISQAELGMMMKAIHQYVREFPKLGLGDAGTRGTRLLSWKINVTQALLPCGPALEAWWLWCVQKAERAYTLFIDATIYEREAIVPKELMPLAWKLVHKAVG